MIKKHKINQKMINTVINFVLIFFIGLAILMSSWYVRQNSIYFFTDIARDFLLLEEIVAKKIVLIGPRASGMEGVFHGPLWLYLNLPAFLLGQGNPVTVGWFWVFLTILFLSAVFVVSSKIFTNKVGLLYIAMLSGFFIPHTYGLFNPHGALITLPFFIFSLFHYFSSNKQKFLTLHLFLAGIIIQFQMAVGVPLLLLSSFLTIKNSIKNKQLKHLYSYFILLVPLSTFFLFELLHNFAQARAALQFLSNKTDVEYFSYLKRAEQRVNLAISTGLYVFVNQKLDFLNRLAGVVVSLELFSNYFKLKTRQKKIFQMTAYFYFGFYIISLIFNGMLLEHYWIVLLPLSYLMISLILSSMKAVPQLIFVIIILVSSYFNGSEFIKNHKQAIGQIEDDWAFQNNLTQKIFSQNDDSFGYFLFTPDIYAYESKYAMSYASKKKSNKTASVYEKKPITYLVIAPVPKERPDILASEWKKNRVGIHREADELFKLPDEYIIEKYYLSDKEVSVPADPNINDWIHFR